MADTQPIADTLPLVSNVSHKLPGVWFEERKDGKIVLPPISWADATYGIHVTDSTYEGSCQSGLSIVIREHGDVTNSKNNAMFLHTQYNCPVIDIRQNPTETRSGVELFALTWDGELTAQSVTASTFRIKNDSYAVTSRMNFIQTVPNNNKPVDLDTYREEGVYFFPCRDPNAANSYQNMPSGFTSGLLIVTYRIIDITNFQEQTFISTGRVCARFAHKYCSHDDPSTITEPWSEWIIYTVTPTV